MLPQGGTINEDRFKMLDCKKICLVGNIIMMTTINLLAPNEKTDLLMNVLTNEEQE